ncbi:MAG: hypothetical protein AAGB46_18495 [Verrucomicrobiota bacterium]
MRKAKIPTGIGRTIQKNKLPISDLSLAKVPAAREANPLYSQGRETFDSPQAARYRARNE